MQGSFSIAKLVGHFNPWNIEVCLSPRKESPGPASLDKSQGRRCPRRCPVCPINAGGNHPPCIHVKPGFRASQSLGTHGSFDLARCITTCTRDA